MRYFRSWIVAWATLIDGIVSVLSLGFWWPNLSFKATVWSAKADPVITHISENTRDDPPFFPKKDFFKLPEDNPICKAQGHLHLIRIKKEEEWWSGTAHCFSCYRCGWSDPCVWT